MIYSEPLTQNSQNSYEHSSFYRLLSNYMLLVSLVLFWAICKHGFNPFDAFGLMYLPFSGILLVLFLIPLVINFTIYMGYVNSNIDGDFLWRTAWYTIILFGVTLPICFLWLIALLFNTTGITDYLVVNDIGGSFFLLALTCSLPLNNIWTLSKTLKQDYTNPISIGLVNGAALSTAALYTMLLTPVFFKILDSYAFRAYSPFMGGSVIATMLIFTIIPLGTLILALLVSIELWKLHKTDVGQTISRTTNLTMIICLVLIIAPGLQSLLVSVESCRALSKSRTGFESRKLLKLFCCEDEILRRCYYQGEARIQFLPMIYAVYNNGANFHFSHDSKNARQLFYKLTGQCFNQFQRPKKDASISWLRLFDQAQGSQTVGGKLDKLKLVESNIDCITEKQSLLTRYVWKVEFKNEDSTPCEARCQILLPPKGIVTDMKLWINGIAKDASFTEKHLAKNTYRKIVRVNRDPALVTTKGQQRIMLQCFPVPAKGKIKVALQVAAPFNISSKSKAFFSMPQIIESNFKVNRKHKVQVINSDNNKKVALKEIENSKMSDYFYPVSIEGESNPGIEKQLALSMDSEFSQSIISYRNTPAQSVVFVVDCSKALTSYINKIKTMIAKLPNSIKAYVYLASEIADEQYLESDNNKNLANTFSNKIPEQLGGVDNTFYLLKGLELAERIQASHVVWIHGPQPVCLDKNAQTKTIELLNSTNLKIYEYQVKAGRSLITEKIDSSESPLARPILLQKRFPDDDLSSVILRKLTDNQVYEVAIAKHLPKTTTSNYNSTSRNTALALRALYSQEKVNQYLNNSKQEEAIRVAKEARIVTPVTAAIVLENARQYKNVGIKEAQSPYTEIKPISLEESNPINLRLNSLSSLSSASACAGGSYNHSYYCGQSNGYFYNANNFMYGSSKVKKNNHSKAIFVALILGAITILLGLTKLLEKNETPRQKKYIYIAITLSGLLIVLLANQLASLLVYLQLV